MAVTARPRDVIGANLQTNVTSLTASAAAIASTSNGTKAAAAASLDQAQRELVEHFLANGRLTAANILSTMT